MKPNYREDKATQAASVLLKLRGGRMSYLKLMKLLYLADREALLRWGRPITYDSYVSMNHGPVLSQTLNILIGSYETEGPWKQAMSQPEGYEISIISDPGIASLSQAEEELLRELYGKYGRLSRWELVDYTHSLPEWRDPQGSSIAIEYKDILRTTDYTASDIAAILDELDGIARMEETLSR